jgi:hypothetical protein
MLANARTLTVNAQEVETMVDGKAWGQAPFPLSQKMRPMGKGSLCLLRRPLSDNR